jgi:homocysteine S-methyltransferase
MGGGQEYTGDYGELTREQLYAFHYERILILAKCEGIDLLALETIPSLIETQVLLQVAPDLIPTFLHFIMLRPQIDYVIT